MAISEKTLLKRGHKRKMACWHNTKSLPWKDEYGVVNMPEKKSMFKSAKVIANRIYSLVHKDKTWYQKFAKSSARWAESSVGLKERSMMRMILYHLRKLFKLKGARKEGVVGVNQQ
ncbi:unnamed protein product [Peronospora belbahrii]|uniref:Uncharacterized protein n=1 Tax=Peronospora belbahrii TaxID=622444 RepID=A0AAU9LDP0_9STRA|nr:unnamed protein product [Peronospora belbahrii]CAH0521904.1 unnamed protein product [Peronospora belbahrii]